MAERVYELASSSKGKLEDVLKANPYADVSFSKQGYKLKDGRLIGGDAGKLYLYLEGGDDFFKYAEAKFKEAELQECAGCEAGLESRIIAQIHEEDSSAEHGMGAIFG